MTRYPLPVLIGIIAAGACLSARADGPPELKTLVTNSPFGQPAVVTNPQSGQESSVLELRGVMMDRGEYFFSLHDIANRTSQWVGLNESGQPFLVESYDPAAGSIQVKYHNQALTLSLKRAQVVVQTAPPLPTPGSGGPPRPAVTATPAPPDEAARLARIAEEIRRRRAIRAQIGGPGLPPRPQAGGPGLPPQPQAGPGLLPDSAGPTPANLPRTP